MSHSRFGRLFQGSAPFPAYRPDSDGDVGALEHVGREVNRWGRRILTLVGLLGLLGTVASFGGWKMFGPRERFDSLSASIAAVRTTSAADITSVRDSLTRVSLRVEENERTGISTLYIACELLLRSQPAAIPPDECSDAAQRARRKRPDR